MRRGLTRKSRHGGSDLSQVPPGNGKFPKGLAKGLSKGFPKGFGTGEAELRDKNSKD
jgi:hypothetical protein